ncbi:MAG: HAMP domain-containing histidine kinase [Oligoflexia bacterium]|nr:HAMP domain-containing histidine kinase [Oligoflexia bacterium]
MNGAKDFHESYGRFLKNHLYRLDESSLREAYEAGRDAYTKGIGILELLEAHESAVQILIREAASGQEAVAIGQKAHALLIECLAPFEIANRGFREANEQLIQKNLRLQQSHYEERFLSETAARLTATLEPEYCIRTIILQALKEFTHACVLETVETGGTEHYVYSGRGQPAGAPAIRFFRHRGGSGSCLMRRPPQKARGLAMNRLGQPDEEWREYDLKAQDRLLGRIAIAKGPGIEGRQSFLEQYILRASTALHNSVLYREARQAIRDREDLLKVVSHDLKNPLSSISLNSELISKGLDLGWQRSMIKAAAQRIKVGSETMKSMINDILDLGRIESGKFALDRSDLPVRSIIADAVNLMAQIVQSKKIELKTQVECPDLLIHCDPGRVLQVFSNLIGNAIKFTPPGGTITLRARSLEASVLFSVVDTGSGILPENLPHVFDRLWQAGPSSRAGIGFGLFIARTIIEAHGGEICPDSAPGTGSTFFFTIPTAEHVRKSGSSAA